MDWKRKAGPKQPKQGSYYNPKKFRLVLVFIFRPKPFLLNLFSLKHKPKVLDLDVIMLLFNRPVSRKMDKLPH